MAVSLDGTCELSMDSRALNWQRMLQKECGSEAFYRIAPGLCELDAINRQSLAIVGKKDFCDSPFFIDKLQAMLTCMNNGSKIALILPTRLLQCKQSARG